MTSYHFKCSVGSTTGDEEVGANKIPLLPRPLVSYDELEWEKIVRAKALPVLDPGELSYDEFFANYLINNIPCVFSPEVTSSWNARHQWTTEDTADNLNFDKMLELYGEAPIDAVNCGDKEYKEGYGSRDCREMSFKDFIEYWKECMTFQNENDSKKPCLYLKDWHIVQFHKSSGISELPYATPVYFQSDWLNEACDTTDSDDFKFCYMGPKGSFTSFHADVYGSYSWSANISGVKKWFLYPPGKELMFYNSSEKLKYNWDEPGKAGQDYIEVVQKPGECIFVPSGWHHVVWNLTDAISINHNWFNGCNICYIWSVLQCALKEVEAELKDLNSIPEFVDQCQIVLKANHGMDYKGFFDLLSVISENRKSLTLPSSLPHSQFDLEAVRHVIEEHCATDEVVKMHFQSEIERIKMPAPARVSAKG